VPYTHESPAAVSTDAVALSVEKWGSISDKSGSAQVATWTLKGVNRNNSDASANSNALTLYWILTNETTTRTLKLYKDHAMANEVATGDSVGDGTITLVESNASGITGTVAVTYTADDTDIGNQLIISPRAVYAKITVDAQPIRYHVDNTVPTDTDGLYAAASSVIELMTSEEIMNFRMIRQGSADANVFIAYYE